MDDQPAQPEYVFPNKPVQRWVQIARALKSKQPQMAADLLAVLKSTTVVFTPSHHLTLALTQEQAQWVREAEGTLPKEASPYDH